jgi:hypothetical protein
MPNTIKYSTTGDTFSLKKGNFFIGTGDVGKGPSNVTKTYNVVSPAVSGYTVYQYNASQESNISFYSANNDAELITFTNSLAGQTFTGITQCLSWYATQTNNVCVNKDYESIVTNGLVLNLDAGFTPSYSRSGTTLYDLSYSGNNGTLTNGPTYNPTKGGTIVFDGVDDIITVSDSNSLDIANNISVDCWFYPTSYRTDTYSINFLKKYNGTLDGNFQLYFAGTYSPNIIRVLATRGGVWGTVSPDSGIIPLNQWCNVVWTYSNGGRLYINGVSQGNPVGSGDLSTNTYNLLIGDDLIGNISTTKIYNREISSTEVLQNYQAQFPRFLGKNIVMNGLVNYLDAGYNVSYPGTGTTWNNISGVSGGTGTLTNGVAYSGLNGGYFDFDGTNDFVDIPYNSYWDNNVFGNATNFTISCWVKCDVFFNWTCLIQKAPTASGFYASSEGASLWVNSTGFQAVFGNGATGSNPSGYGNIWSFSTSNTNGWYHLLFTGDGTIGRFYVNGSLSVQASLSRTLPVTTSLNGPKLGVRSGPTYYNGKIANTLLYTRPLSATEVLQNYQAQFPQILGENIITNGLVFYIDSGYGSSYPTTGTTWYDVSGMSGRTATLINGPTYSSANGGSLTFDGTDDYASTNVSTTTLGMIGGSFTVCCWFYCDNISITDGGLVNSQTANSAGNAYEMGVRFNSLWVGFYAGDQYVPILNNTWYCAVHTYNYGTKSSKVYVNGVLGSSSIRTVNLASTANIRIGIYSSNDREFNGKINIVQIYNRELSSTEVLQNYNAQKSRFGL